MTDYFDRAVLEVGKAVGLDGIAGVESRVIYDVNFVTGDREFPHDLRESIQTAIATTRVHSPDGVPTKGDGYACALSLSLLIASLHELFHEVATRQIQTRFGVLSDSPRAILSMRDAHDLG